MRSGPSRIASTQNARGFVLCALVFGVLVIVIIVLALVAACATG
jgi:hypothetical protein